MTFPGAPRLLVGEALWSPEAGFVRLRGPVAALLDHLGVAREHGPAGELAAKHPHLPVDEGEGVLLPGFVDCHAHLELAALAGAVPGGGGLGAWVARLVRVRAGIPEEDFLPAALQAAQEMRALGTVAAADVCTNLATAPILREAGLLGLSLLEVVGADDAAAERAFAHGEARRGAHPPTEGLDVRLVPHSAYGTAPSAIRRLAGPAGVRSIHAAEHEDEDRWLLEGGGPFAPFLLSRGAVPPRLRALPFLDDLRAMGEETLLVHLVTASEDELRAARLRGATAVLCPRSNLHIGGRLPDLPAIRRSGIPWVLGTDSLASTPDHDLLGEVRLLAEAFPEVGLHELLEAATVRGARALGLPSHPWVRIPWERFPQEAFA